MYVETEACSSHRVSFRAALVAALGSRRWSPGVAHDDVQPVGQLSLGLPRFLDVGVAQPAQGTVPLGVTGTTQVATEAAVGGGAGRVADGGGSERQEAGSGIALAGRRAEWVLRCSRLQFLERS